MRLLRFVAVLSIAKLAQAQTEYCRGLAAGRCGRHSDGAHYDCASNEMFAKDYDVLLSAVAESVYIFGARVLDVRTSMGVVRSFTKVFHVYKLYVQRVLKGDISSLRKYVYEGASDTLNGAVVFVEWVRTSECETYLRKRTSAIFLSGDFYEAGKRRRRPRLRLLNEPLPYTTREMGRVNGLYKCCARGRPIIVEWERDARHSAGLSLSFGDSELHSRTPWAASGRGSGPARGAAPAQPARIAGAFLTERKSDNALLVL
ncbi:hypothetical protein EVAR_9310_1 [Eumeta japonica]|uniref:NTR domain-containing protein n=1 Tax=Eumeta variegata TaxID=151549 RepID=A0A4C1TLY7_EUMVA|nr:hypothetical protein EVAR_9310_1 [Eumeta japonica]